MALWALLPFVLPAVQALPKAATPSPTPTGSPTATSSPPAVTGNPYEGVDLFVNPYYKSEVEKSAIPSMTGSMAEQASAAANVPSFYWLYVVSRSTGAV